MPEDPRAEPPEQPKTVNIPAMTDRALLEDLRGVVKEGFRLTNANIEVVADDLRVVKDRVSILENERAKHSGGIRNLSSSDSQQDAQLAQERMAREAMAKELSDLKAAHVLLDQKQDTQTAILITTAGDVRKFLATPTVKVVGGVLFGIVSSYLAQHYGVVLPK